MTGYVSGKVAIVTGGGRGIGRAIAMLMAKEGASVVVVDIGAALDGSGGDQGPAQEVVNEIKAAGGKAIASTLSITEPQNAEAIVKSAIDTFGRVDILVNNAGILRDRIFHRMSWSDWHDVINVHLNGSFNMARAVSNHFRDQNSGAMVHMTSTSGLIGNFGQANYMAAKLGIHGLSRGIALDMQRYNVRSNCISPSAWSRMIGSIPTETEAEKVRVERLKQMTPEKIAPLAVYLCSEVAEGISGQIIGVRNNEIFLYSQPRPIRVLHRSDGWTVEKLDAQLKGAFKQSLTPLERSGDVFSWDPVLMTIVYDKLLALEIPASEQTYTERDTIFYSLSLGLGQDPVSTDELPFVYEQGTKVLPTFPVVVAMPGFWARELDTGIDWVKVVHGEHDVVLHKPLPTHGSVVSHTRIVEVIDKGAGKGAIVVSKRELNDKTNGAHYATITQTTFCRGDGGFGGPPRQAPAPHALPDRAPDAVCDLVTRPEMALIYRWNADMNPLHADPAIAKAAGFPRPILHGLATYGVSGHAILKTMCGYDPSRFRSMAVRFSAPVYPGETIRTEMWRDGAIVSFRARAVERDVVVLNNGRAETGT